MNKTHKILTNTYRDSVALMKISAGAMKIKGVRQASIVMASPMNLELAVQAGLIDSSIQASASDLLIALETDTETSSAEVLKFIDTQLHAQASSEDTQHAEQSYRTIFQAKNSFTDLNLALISTPGDYAASEAMKALKSGCNVMIFSDNVSVEEEIMLKSYAKEKKLLVMGPDCGTAVINGIPLAFANVLKKGSVGVAAASGTGLQEVTTLINDLGVGISQAVGTGGRDLHEKIGGITMLQVLEMLDKDPNTKIILLVSKPPAESVAKKILEKVQTIKKPVVINFLGGKFTNKKIVFASTLKDAAIQTCALLEKSTPEKLSKKLTKKIPNIKYSFSNKQKYLRALYSGGTFAYEALILFADLPNVYSNLHYGAVQELENLFKSKGHTILDMGDDAFTRGKPHPMIDYSFRNERILKEAKDPETAIIIVDVVLGYGSHDNPASELAPVIKKSIALAKKDKRELVFFGRVCATDLDPQNRAFQEQMLKEAGLVIFPSNADMLLHTQKVLRTQIQKSK